MKLGLTGLVLLTAACDRSIDQAPVADPVVTESAVTRGRTIALRTVSDSAYPAGIGIPAGVELVEFSDGRLVVVDRRAQTVGILNEDSLFRWLRPALPPSSSLVGVAVAGDTVGILTRTGSETLVYFLLDDETLLDSIRMTREPGTQAQSLHSTNSGWTVVVGRHRDETGYLRQVEFAAHVLNGTGGSTIAYSWLDPAPSYRIGEGGSWTFRGVEAPRSLVASHPSQELLISADSAYRVRRVDRAGAQVQDITIGTERVPVRYDASEYLASYSDEAYRTAAQAVLDTVPPAPSRRSVGGLWLSGNGSFAVLRSDLTKPVWENPDSVFIDVFSTDDAYLGTAALPARFQVVAFTGSAFVGVFEDAVAIPWQPNLDTPRITGVYRIER